MLHYRILIIMMASGTMVFLTWASLLADEPYKWPEKLPDSVIQLIKTERPPFPRETGLSKEFGLELLTKAMRPDTSMKSGVVLIEREKFMPERLHAGRVPLVKIRLFFDRNVQPALWAQWTDGIEKQCAFIRGQNASYLSEQFPQERTRQRIIKRPADYVPRSKYCDEFPLFTFTSVLPFMVDRPSAGELYAKRIRERGIDAVEQEGKEHYLVHLTGKSSSTTSKYSEYHTVWWITTHEPFQVVRMIGWSRFAQTGEWKVKIAIQNEYEKREGIYVPKLYVSYLLSEKSDERGERIRFFWQDVNTPLPPELFNDGLLEPKANSVLFDKTEKKDGVIGVPYRDLKKQKANSE